MTMDVKHEEKNVFHFLVFCLSLFVFIFRIFPQMLPSFCHFAVSSFLTFSSIYQYRQLTMEAWTGKNRSWKCVSSALYLALPSRFPSDWSVFSSSSRKTCPDIIRSSLKAFYHVGTVPTYLNKYFNRHLPKNCHSSNLRNKSFNDIIKVLIKFVIFSFLPSQVKNRNQTLDHLAKS